MLDEKLRSKEIFLLLKANRLESMWESNEVGFGNGPTRLAVSQLSLIKTGESLLSFGEQIILRIAFDLWNGAGDASLWNMMVYLDAKVLISVMRAIERCSKA